MGLKERIREAMGKRGNAEFASAMKVSPASVTFWLDGSTRSLSAENAAQMEKVTGYRAKWIVTGQGPKRLEDQTGRDNSWPLSPELLNAIRERPEEAAWLENVMRAIFDMPRLEKGSAEPGYKRLVLNQSEEDAPVRRKDARGSS